MWLMFLFGGFFIAILILFIVAKYKKRDSQCEEFKIKPLSIKFERTDGEKLDDEISQFLSVVSKNLRYKERSYRSYTSDDFNVLYREYLGEVMYRMSVDSITHFPPFKRLSILNSLELRLDRYDELEKIDKAYTEKHVDIQRERNRMIITYPGEVLTISIILKFKCITLS